MFMVHICSFITSLYYNYHCFLFSSSAIYKLLHHRYVRDKLSKRLDLRKSIQKDERHDECEIEIEQIYREMIVTQRLHINIQNSTQPQYHRLYWQYSLLFGLTLCTQMTHIA